jgi:hypothetical protein
MKRSRWLLFLLPGLLALAALTAVLLLAMLGPTASMPVSQTIGLAIGLFLVGVVSGLTANILVSRKRIRTFAILGFPASGKTVYLTVLFNLLQRSDEQSVEVEPQGQDTIEKIHTDFATLARQEWLSPTATDHTFTYHAVSTRRRWGAVFRSEIMIPDYAGEFFHQLSEENQQWLHKNPYFLNWVLRADGLFLAVDCDVLGKASQAEKVAYEQSFIAAIQVLLETSPAARRLGRIPMPVALLFMKADVLASNQSAFLERSLPQLVSLCKRKCTAFGSFAVSSTGSRCDDDTRPPANLRPYQVLESFMWLLHRR